MDTVARKSHHRESIFSRYFPAGKQFVTFGRIGIGGLSNNACTMNATQHKIVLFATVEFHDA